MLRSERTAKKRRAQTVIFRMLQRAPARLEMGWVIPDLTIVSDAMEVLVARSVEAFSKTKVR